MSKHWAFLTDVHGKRTLINPEHVSMVEEMATSEGNGQDQTRITFISGERENVQLPFDTTIESLIGSVTTETPIRFLIKKGKS